MSQYRNTDNKSITQAMIDASDEIEIISGEGEDGTREDYEGARTARAIKARLAKERCNGDRWAILVLDGERI